MNTISIIIFGELAVGKLTVAKIVSKSLDIKLSHNHLSYDLIYSLFERGSERATRLIEPMRFDPYIEAAKEGISFVTTHTYAHDFVSITGQSDPEYLLKLERELLNAGSTPYFIFLKASNEKILQRAVQEDRKNHGKLVDKSIVQSILAERSDDIAPDLTNLFELDTTNMTAHEVAQKVVSFIKK